MVRFGQLCLGILVMLTAFVAEMHAQTQSVSTASVNNSLNFVPATKLLSEIRKAAPRRPGVSWVNYIDSTTSEADVVRRTAAGRSELHQDVVDIWYVIDGGGTLVTGGKLSGPIENEKDEVKWQSTAKGPNELRGRGIFGGEQRVVGKGDFVTIPAGTPHWLSKVDGEIVYLVVKVPSPR